MNPRVLLTRRLFPEAEALLRPRFAITRTPSHAEGALVQLTDRIDAAFLDATPRLRVISQCAVGVDNIDLRETTKRGITVMNTPGVLTESTADMTWALILAVARRLAEGDRLCRDGRFPGWDLEFMLGADVHGGTLGIIGPGRIGKAVARRAAGFGMRVLCTGARRRTRAPQRGMKPVALRELLSTSDIVTVHVPATPRTLHLIGRRELGWMKRSAFLINTSRGSAVDTGALVRALGSGAIAGAGLDVFEEEPLVPRSLARLRQVVLTPHIASATRRTRGAMASTAARNLVDFFYDAPDPRHIVRGR